MISLFIVFIDIIYLKYYIVWFIEFMMMRFGFYGLDIIFLLEGFGCNVVVII